MTRGAAVLPCGRKRRLPDRFADRTDDRDKSPGRLAETPAFFKGKTLYARVLGRMGEFEGEGTPFCRKQRPDGRPQAVSVRRRRSLTGIDSRAGGFLPPQKNYLVVPRPKGGDKGR